MNNPLLLPALFAFLHHASAFIMFAALAYEWMIFRPAGGPPALSLTEAKRLQWADMMYGISAGTLVLFGLLRVFYFEKGAGFYGHNVFFWIKMTLILAAGLLSIYPTVKFLQWSKALKAGEAPLLATAVAGNIRLIINVEMLLILLAMLCAPLMARGLWMLS